MKKTLFSTILLSAGIYGIAQSSCSLPITIGVGTHTVSGITGTAPPSSCSLPAGTNGSWYKYVPTQSGIVTVSTVIAGQNVNTQVRVFASGCGTTSCIAANDDFTGTSAQVSFTAYAGTSYFIAFDNRWSSSGFNFTLSQAIRTSNLTFNSQSVSASGSYNNCVVDMNGDYLDDIVSVISATQLNIAYQQASGSYTTQSFTVPSTTITPSWSIAAGDYDNNGYTDLMYGSGSGIAFLKANSTGTGYTSDRKPQSFLTQRTNFVDFNNDGKLDAFACDDNAPNRYYLNDGTNLNHYQGGMGDFPSGGNYGSIFTDIDNDGDQDLYIAKCSGGGSGPGGNVDELHLNNGSGVYTNIATTANMANPTQTWSAAWGDFNNDGWMDSVVGINSTTNGWSKVMKNNGNGTFTDMTAGSGYDTTSSLSREYAAYDFDNDGFLDVLGGGNTIMFGNGNFQFTPNPSVINGINLYDRPIGDLNNDGFLDIQNGTNALMNNGNTNKWLKVTLQGVQSNRSGIGARVEIYGSWGKQIRDVQSGVGFGNMNTLNTHFGIGQATVIPTVIVRWPSGIVDTLHDISPNSTLFVLEGFTMATSEVLAEDSSFTAYPNPVDDILYFDLKKGSVAVMATVIDISGRIVMQKKPERNSLNVQQLKSGMYMIILKDKKGQELKQKIIKK